MLINCSHCDPAKAGEAVSLPIVTSLLRRSLRSLLAETVGAIPSLRSSLSTLDLDC